jgi:hypothetical protein
MQPFELSQVGAGELEVRAAARLEVRAATGALTIC